MTRSPTLCDLFPGTWGTFSTTNCASRTGEPWKKTSQRRFPQGIGGAEVSGIVDQFGGIFKSPSGGVSKGYLSRVEGVSG